MGVSHSQNDFSVVKFARNETNKVKGMAMKKIATKEVGGGNNGWVENKENDTLV